MPRIGLPEMLILAAVILTLVAARRGWRIFRGRGPRMGPPAPPSAVFAGVPRHAPLRPQPDEERPSMRGRSTHAA